MRKLLFAILMASGIAQANLLTNGDFESGNIGFGTAHTFNATVGLESTYTVDSTVPNNWSPGFGDHTSGSGLMLIVNASTDTSDTFWSQSISTTGGNEYTFSGWVAVLTGPGLPVPTLEVKVDGTSIGTWVVPDVDDTWQSFSFSWTGSGAAQTISMYDSNGQAGGCDFAVDDLQAVPEPASVLFILVGGGLIALKRRFFSTR